MPDDLFEANEKGENKPKKSIYFGLLIGFISIPSILAENHQRRRQILSDYPAKAGGFTLFAP